MHKVTFDEWDACVAAKACEAVADDGWGRGRPVLYVNFEMAMGYARWLSQKIGETGTSGLARHDCNDGYAKTAPVGSFKPK